MQFLNYNICKELFKLNVVSKQLQQKLFETRRKEFLTESNAKRTTAAMIADEYNANAQLAKEGFVSRSQANQL
jgi:hypothetical protein